MSALPATRPLRAALSHSSEAIDEFVRLEAAAIYQGIQTACQRIISMDGNRVNVEVSETAYVLDGRTYRISTFKGEYYFWIGINGPRLFFICYMKGIDTNIAKTQYQFCFGGAEKAGWEMNYEPLGSGGVSIWASTITERNLPLCTHGSDVNGVPSASMTPEGIYWATDIAMMVQSWIRTSQRKNIMCSDQMPAPL